MLGLTTLGALLLNFLVSAAFVPELCEDENGELLLKIPIMDDDDGPLPQYYCFSRGRHSGSFFLKFGAAAFAMGHLVHIGLQLGKQIVFFLEHNDNASIDDIFNYECDHIESLLFTILLGPFIAMQLYIVFKYSNVIVNRRRSLARFGLMHMIMISLCLWVYGIVRETMDSIVDKKYFAEHSYCFSQEDEGYGGYDNDTDGE